MKLIKSFLMFLCLKGYLKNNEKGLQKYNEFKLDLFIGVSAKASAVSSMTWIHWMLFSLVPRTESMGENLAIVFISSMIVLFYMKAFALDLKEVRAEIDLYVKSILGEVV